MWRRAAYCGLPPRGKRHGAIFFCAELRYAPGFLVASDLPVRELSSDATYTIDTLILVWKRGRAPSFNWRGGMVFHLRSLTAVSLY